MRRTLHVSPVLVASVAGLALAGCTPAADGAVVETTTPVLASPSTAPSSSPVDGLATTRVSADDLTIDVLAPDGAAGVEASGGSTSVSIDLAMLAPGEAATFTLSSDGELTQHPDGSVTVASGGGSDDDGADDDASTNAVGGLTAPTGGATFHQSDPRTVELVADDGASGTVTVALGARGVLSTDWGDREGGRSLAVEPTDWARGARTAGVDVVWSELVADDPGVASATMHDQLVCHSIGAPDKATWNLEPWRPDVGLLQVLADRCNPV